MGNRRDSPYNYKNPAKGTSFCCKCSSYSCKCNRLSFSIDSLLSTTTVKLNYIKCDNSKPAHEASTVEHASMIALDLRVNRSETPSAIDLSISSRCYYYDSQSTATYDTEEVYLPTSGPTPIGFVPQDDTGSPTYLSSRYTSPQNVSPEQLFATEYREPKTLSPSEYSTHSDSPICGSRIDSPSSPTCTFSSRNSKCTPPLTVSTHISANCIPLSPSYSSDSPTKYSGTNLEPYFPVSPKSPLYKSNTSDHINMDHTSPCFEFPPDSTEHPLQSPNYSPQNFLQYKCKSLDYPLASPQSPGSFTPNDNNPKTPTLIDTSPISLICTPSSTSLLQKTSPECIPISWRNLDNSESCNNNNNNKIKSPSSTISQQSPDLKESPPSPKSSMRKEAEKDDFTSTDYVKSIQQNDLPSSPNNSMIVEMKEDISKTLQSRKILNAKVNANSMNVRMKNKFKSSKYRNTVNLRILRRFTNYISRLKVRKEKSKCSQYRNRIKENKTPDSTMCSRKAEKEEEKSISSNCQNSSNPKDTPSVEYSKKVELLKDKCVPSTNLKNTLLSEKYSMNVEMVKNESISSQYQNHRNVESNYSTNAKMEEDKSVNSKDQDSVILKECPPSPKNSMDVECEKDHFTSAEYEKSIQQKGSLSPPRYPTNVETKKDKSITSQCPNLLNVKDSAHSAMHSMNVDTKKHKLKSSKYRNPVNLKRLLVKYIKRLKMEDDKSKCCQSQNSTKQNETPHSTMCSMKVGKEEEKLISSNCLNSSNLKDASSAKHSKKVALLKDKSVPYKNRKSKNLRNNPFSAKYSMDVEMVKNKSISSQNQNDSNIKASHSSNGKIEEDNCTNSKDQNSVNLKESPSPNDSMNMEVEGDNSKSPKCRNSSNLTDSSPSPNGSTGVETMIDLEVEKENSDPLNFSQEPIDAESWVDSLPTYVVQYYVDLVDDDDDDATAAGDPKSDKLPKKYSTLKNQYSVIVPDDSPCVCCTPPPIKEN